MGCHLPETADINVPTLFVEFAHIYADEVWGDEQSKSIEVMKDYLAANDPNNLVISAVLIDELHVEKDTLDINEFIRCMLRRGVAPDHVVFEGKLEQAAKQIIAIIGSRIGLNAEEDGPECDIVWRTFKKAKKKVCFFEFHDGCQVPLVTHWDDGRKEFSCAILSAAWSLCRVGLLEFPKGSVISLTNAPLYGDTIVSVLHSKYKPVEEKVARLIRATGLAVEDRMSLVYFD